MATDAKRKKFLYLERERLTRYQHQHRGLSFLKLWLPPITDRDVNIIGLNDHIYKGKIPTVPLDQLPPEVDPKSVDEEQLYKEIQDMRFPVAPPLEPLGPTRRVGGVYTTAKRMTFAPVQISLADDKTQMPLIGKDGKIYQGRIKAGPAQELDQRLKGTKRLVKTPAQYESDRGTVEPTVVTLYVDGKPPSERKPHVPVVQMPRADLNKLVKLMEIKSPEQEKEATKTEKQPEEDAEQEEDSKPTEVEESEGESSREFASSESIGETAEASELEETTTTGTEVSSEMTIDETSTTTGTEASSEVTEPTSEGEEIEESEPEEEVREALEPEIPEAEPEEEETDIAEPGPEEEAAIVEPGPEEEAAIVEPGPEEEAAIAEPGPEEEAAIAEPEPEVEPEVLESEPEET